LAWPELEPQLQALRRACLEGDVDGIKAVLGACVQGYGEPAGLAVADDAIQMLA
jgi:hypothetical protein